MDPFGRGSAITIAIAGSLARGHAGEERRGAEPRERRLVMLAAVGNGRFFGGGMKICPEARIDDGALDLVTVGDFSKGEVLVNLGRLYEGTHLELDAVENARVTGADGVGYDSGLARAVLTFKVPAHADLSRQVVADERTHLGAERLLFGCEAQVHWRDPPY